MAWQGGAGQAGSREADSKGPRQLLSLLFFHQISVRPADTSSTNGCKNALGSTQKPFLPLWVVLTRGLWYSGGGVASHMAMSQCRCHLGHGIRLPCSHNTWEAKRGQDHGALTLRDIYTAERIILASESSTWQAETRGSQAQSQLGLPMEALSQNNKQH